MKPRKEDALMAIAPGAGFMWRGDEYSGLEWEEGNVVSKPTEAEINAKLTSMISDWEAQQYSRDRASAYDSVGDQLDQLMKDMKNGTTTHQTACEAVKAQFPKP
jgi:hypothetical protein